MAKTIAEQIEELELENTRLKEFEKLFEKALKIEFGTSSKSIKKMMRKAEENESDFEKKISSYFNLNSPEEKEEFLRIVCTDSSLRYFNGKRENAADEEAGIATQKDLFF